MFHLTPIRPLLIWTQLSNSAKQLAVMTNSLGSGLDATFSLMIYHELYIEIYIYILNIVMFHDYMLNYERVQDWIHGSVNI